VCPSTTTADPLTVSRDPALSPTIVMRVSSPDTLKLRSLCVEGAIEGATLPGVRLAYFPSHSSVASFPVPQTMLREALPLISCVVGPSFLVQQRALTSEQHLLPSGGVFPVIDRSEVRLSTSIDSPPLEDARTIEVQGSEERVFVASHNPTLHDGYDSPLEAGAREPEETESTIYSLLDSLIPSIKVSEQAIKLPTYIGRTCIDSGESFGNTKSKNKQAS
jgi:hypothetical protein